MDQTRVFARAFAVLASLTAASSGSCQITPTLLGDLVPGTGSSFPHSFFETAGGTFFAADANRLGVELFVTDGTPAGTRLVKDIAIGTSSSEPDHFVVLPSGRVLFAASQPSVGRELFTTDGTAAGTTVFVDLVPGAGSSNPGPFVWHPLRRAYVFRAQMGAGLQLWQTDGTGEGTVQIQGVFEPGEMVVRRDGLMFLVAADQPNGFNTELWTLGTGAPTLIEEINPNTGSNPDMLVAGDSQVLFYAQDGTHGRELWQSDGTAAGTNLVMDITAGPADSIPFGVRGAFAFGFFWFAARRPDIGEELFAYRFGVHHWDLVPGPNDSQPRDFTATSAPPDLERLFFTAGDVTRGRELWVRRDFSGSLPDLIDLEPGPGSSDPHDLLAVGFSLYCAATRTPPNQPTRLRQPMRVRARRQGNEIAVADGLEAAGRLTLTRHAVVCEALDSGLVSGQEPYRLRVTDAYAWYEDPTRPRRPPCGPSQPTITAQAPVLGETSEVAGDTDPAAIGFLFLGMFGRIPIPVGQCQVEIEPIAYLIIPATNLAGRWQTSLPIPNNPGLLGLTVDAQAAFLEPSAPPRLSFSSGASLHLGD